MHKSKWKNTVLERVERDVILQGLAANNGNRTQTAKQLGISLRTLKTRIILYKECGFEVTPVTK